MLRLKGKALEVRRREEQGEGREDKIEIEQARRMLYCRRQASNYIKASKNGMKRAHHE